MFNNNLDLFKLVERYGSPLYVYSESILRERCREVLNLLPRLNFKVNYSAKANSNLELLKIVRDEGLDVDAMSPGEIYLQQIAGFSNEQIFYIGNNVSNEEMQYAIDRNILVSVDSLSQLDNFGKINKGGRVAVRFNPGIGAGHHEKVVTAGKKTKFGVQPDFIPQVKELLGKHHLELVGINQHMGSLFLDENIYISGVRALLEIAKHFPDLQFIDLGGGFGVPYQSNEKRLDLVSLSEKLTVVLNEFLSEYPNKNVCFKIEPGRYIVAECGILLGEIYSVKENYGVTYIGTDIGMNVLARPAVYDSYHEVSVSKKQAGTGETELATVVGNICESGDIIAKDRTVPKANVGDILAVMNAGAYGYSMASNYNCRLKPAEVLITSDGSDRLIRKRDTMESLIQNFMCLK